MKLKISTLSPGETELSYSNDKDKWLDEVAKEVEAKGYPMKGAIDAPLSVTKLDDDLILRGTLSFKVELTCARCTEPLEQAISHPFALAFAPERTGGQRLSEPTEAEDQLDQGYYAGDELELEPIIEEQIHLSLPYRALCTENCKGICQDCGQNLNLGECRCKKGARSGAFAVLENLKDQD